MRALYYCPVSFFPRLISAVVDWMSTILLHMVWPQCEFRCRSEFLKCPARGSLEMQDPKISHLSTIAQLCRAISSQLRHISTLAKYLLNSNVSATCPHNMVNVSPLAAEICCRVWGTPANFNGFRVLAALLHGTLILGVSQTTLRR